MHVFPVARVLSIVSSPSHSVGYSLILRGLRVPILDRDWAAQRLLPFRGELPGGASGVQLALPFWGYFPAFSERWMQWNGSLGIQLCTQRRNSLAVPEFLR